MLEFSQIFRPIKAIFRVYPGHLTVKPTTSFYLKN